MVIEKDKNDPDFPEDLFDLDRNLRMEPKIHCDLCKHDFLPLAKQDDIFDVIFDDVYKRGITVEITDKI